MHLCTRKTSSLALAIRCGGIGCDGDFVALIVEAAVLLSVGADIDEGCANLLLAGVAGDCDMFDAGFGIVGRGSIGAWVVGGGREGLRRAVGVEASAKDAREKGHDGRFEHRETGAHDASIGFDGCPNSGIERAIGLVRRLRAAIEGCHAKN